MRYVLSFQKQKTNKYDWITSPADVSMFSFCLILFHFLDNDDDEDVDEKKRNTINDF